MDTVYSIWIMLFCIFKFPNKDRGCYHYLHLVAVVVNILGANLLLPFTCRSPDIKIYNCGWGLSDKSRLWVFSDSPCLWVCLHPEHWHVHHSLKLEISSRGISFIQQRSDHHHPDLCRDSSASKSRLCNFSCCSNCMPQCHYLLGWCLHEAALGRLYS